MVERYFFIQPEIAHSLLDRIHTMRPEKRGIDRRAYLFDDYAVLATDRLKLRNVDIRDDSLNYFHDIINTLAELKKNIVGVVPILGYCFEADSQNGRGFIFQQRARGEELYDDAAICPLEVWTQGKTDVYLSSKLDAQEYILSRTHEIAKIPQAHFDKYVQDILAILDRDILIDFYGKSNFFYDVNEGFQFIDLDSHNDWYYGLESEAPSIEKLAAMGSFVPCHFAIGTKLFAPTALVDQALCTISDANIKRFAEDNQAIFEKCLSALPTNGISKSVINKTLQDIRIYGFDKSLTAFES